MELLHEYLDFTAILHTKLKISLQAFLNLHVAISHILVTNCSSANNFNIQQEWA